MSLPINYQHVAMVQAAFVNYFFQSDFCLNRGKGSMSNGDECKIKGRLKGTFVCS